MTPSIRSLLRRVAIALGACAVCAGAGVLGYFGWLASADRSDIPERPLANGITYRREAHDHPRRVVAHVLTVDLKRPGMQLTISAPLPGARCLEARTTREFLRSSRAAVAINGGFFYPFHSNSPWDYYPRPGDCVHILGRWSAQGQRYGQRWRGVALSLSATLEPTVGRDVPGAPWVIVGHARLVRDGTPLPQGDDPLEVRAYPRNILGVDRTGRHLIAILIDGRQPGYSEGLTLSEAAVFAAQHGCEQAIELDGGGSVTLVARDEHGEPRVLNRPIHTRLPGRERPVANHIGFVAP